MSSYLFLLSIGPVQSFIAQARKTQDLFESSWLLSHLCRSGIDWVKEKYGEQVASCIFPSDKDAASIPNRFLIRLETGESVEDLQKMGTDLAEHLKNEVFVRKYALTRLSSIKGNLQSEDLLERLRNLKEELILDQLNGLLDIQWVIVPINDDYEEAYQETQRLLGAVKQAPPSECLEETGRKCSVCGLRNVRYYRCAQMETKGIFEKMDPLALERLTEQKLFHKKGSVGETAILHTWKFGAGLGLSDLQPGEGLCAVCAAKRFNLGYDFPSTAEVALMYTFEKGMKHHGAYKEITEYMNCYKETEKTFNWQFFYEENISSVDTIEKAGFFLGESDDQKRQRFEKIQKKYLAMSQRLRELGLPFSKYYSLVRFDGDQMGDWLRGEFHYPGTDLERFHTIFSALLSNYAKWVTSYLKEPQGKVIYAGGDDFLGLVNLQHLYEVLDMLREQFECRVNKKLKEEFRDLLKTGSDFTFSAGVVIAHYKTPLQEVLNQAKRLEDIAKAEGGRNALAIGLLQRTGSMRETYWKWYYRDKKLLDLLREANRLLRPDLLSDAFARELIRLAQPMLDKNGELPFETTKELEDSYQSILFSELVRLIQRAKGPLLNDAEADAFTMELKSLLESKEGSQVLNRKPNKNEKENHWRLQNFMTFLEIMMFVSNQTILETEKTVAE